MDTLILQADRSEAITIAVKCLENGGLVAFPTDTVYGLGTSIHQPETIERLYTVKKRELSKAIPLLLGNPNDLTLVGQNIGFIAMRLAEEFWPGPLTLVINRHPSLPEVLSPMNTIGVRMPDHPVALDLLCMSGPLAVTSANLSRAPNSRTADEVSNQLGGQIELILDGGFTPGGIPSTVVDCTKNKLEIIRPGPISVNELRAVLR